MIIAIAVSPPLHTGNTHGRLSARGLPRLLSRTRMMARWCTTLSTTENIITCLHNKNSTLWQFSAEPCTRGDDEIFRFDALVWLTIRMIDFSGTDAFARSPPRLFPPWTTLIMRGFCMRARGNGLAWPTVVDFFRGESGGINTGAARERDLLSVHHLLHLNIMPRCRAEDDPFAEFVRERFSVCYPEGIQ